MANFKKWRTDTPFGYGKLLLSEEDLVRIFKLYIKFTTYFRSVLHQLLNIGSI